MRIDATTSDLLEKVRVLEMCTIAPDNGLRIHPMAAVWTGEDEITITTPIAYARKASNIRRDHRVGLLYSDLTGSGLPDTHPAVLIQGTASVSDGAAAPQDLRAYWRTLLSRHPPTAEDFASDEAREMMAWYYLRLIIRVTLQRVVELAPSSTGGLLEPPPTDDAPLRERIADAVRRYPSVVFAARDRSGYPFASRATVPPATVREFDSAGELVVRTEENFEGSAGPATLLWHRHNGNSGDMTSLQVAGTVAGAGRKWLFLPEYVPGAAAAAAVDSEEAWIADGQARTRNYLQRNHLTAPTIDWDLLTALAPHGSDAGNA